MESPHDFCAVHWDHEPRQLVGRGVLTAPRLGVLGTARPTLRFMESPLSFFRMHWDHELVRGTSPVWSPGFSRSKSFEPPKGGTPNQPRFIERSRMNADARMKAGLPGANHLFQWFTTGRFAAILGVLIIVAFPEVVTGRRTFVFGDYGLFDYP